MVQDPKIFVIQQLSEKLVDKDLNMLGWPESLKRHLNKLNTPGDLARQLLESLSGKSH